MLRAPTPLSPPRASIDLSLTMATNDNSQEDSYADYKNGDSIDANTGTSEASKAATTSAEINQATCSSVSSASNAAATAAATDDKPGATTPPCAFARMRIMQEDKCTYCKKSTVGLNGPNAPAPRVCDSCWRDFGRDRGWSNLRLVSAASSTIKADFGFEEEDGEQHPGISVFTTANSGSIHHFYSGAAPMTPSEYRDTARKDLAPNLESTS